MIKKEFNKKIDFHNFGKRFIAAYFDWQETPDGRGVKYAIFACRFVLDRAKLRKLMYQWAVEGKDETVRHLAGQNIIMYKYAATDKDRFKYPLSVSFRVHTDPDCLRGIIL